MSETVQTPNPLSETVRRQLRLNATPGWRPWLEMLRLNRADPTWIEFLEQMMELNSFDDRRVGVEVRHD